MPISSAASASPRAEVDDDGTYEDDTVMSFDKPFRIPPSPDVVKQPAKPPPLAVRAPPKEKTGAAVPPAHAEEEEEEEEDMSTSRKELCPFGRFL
jgi:hypothetical protein